MFKFTRGWTRWRALQEAVQGTTIEDGPGAYVVRIKDRPVDRALGTDEAGILDIGESVGLRARVRSFHRCASRPGTTGHMAGWRYAHLGLARHFPLPRLEVRWCSTGTKEAAQQMEAEIMTRYVRAFGELPPLNYKFSWKNWAE